MTFTQHNTMEAQDNLVLARDVKDVNFLSVIEDRRDLEVDHPLGEGVKIHVNVFNTLAFLSQERDTIRQHEPPLEKITVYVRGDSDVEDAHEQISVGGTISGYRDGDNFFVATSLGPKATTTVRVRDLDLVAIDHRVFSTKEELVNFLKNREDRAGMYDPSPDTIKAGDEELQLAAATSVDHVRQLKWAMFAPTVNFVLVVPGNVNKVVADMKSGAAVDDKDLSLKEGLLLWKSDTLVMGNIEYGARLKKTAFSDKLCIRYQFM